MMNDSILIKLIQDLSLIFSPSTDNQSRQNVDEIINSPLGMIYAAKLAHVENGFSDQLRHFGCSSLCNCVKFYWANLSHDQKLFLKNTAIELIANGSRHLLQERLFIKEKNISFLVELVKREWPLEWLDLDSGLIQLYDTRKELVLLVYRSLAEDLFLYEDAVAESRKTELMTALTSVMVNATVLSDLYSKTVLQKDVNEGKTDFVLLLNIIRSSPQNVGWISRWMENAQEWILTLKYPNQEDKNRIAERLILALLNALLPLLDWIHVSCLSDTQTLSFLLDCLQNYTPVSIKLASVECLIVLFSRNFPPTSGLLREQLLLIPLFDQQKIHAIYTLHLSIYSCTDYNGLKIAQRSQELDEDVYKLLKRATQMVCSFTNFQITFKRNNSSPAHFSDYLVFLSIAANHPSTLIATLYITEIIGILRHEYFSKSMELSQFIPELINFCLSKVTALLQDSEKLGLVYDQQDFDSTREIKFHQSQLKQRIIDTVRIIAKLKPFDSLAWIISLIQQGLVAGSDKIDTCQFEAYGLFLEAMMEFQKENVDSHALAKSFSADLLQSKLDNVSQITCKISMISSLAMISSLDLNFLLNIIQKLFPFVIYQMGDLNDDAISVRRKAIGALIKIGKEMADPLTAVFTEIMGSISQIISDERISSSERSLLYEFLLSIIFNATESEGANYFDHIMGPILNDDLKKCMDGLQSIEILLNGTGMVYIQGHLDELSMLNNADPLPDFLFHDLNGYRSNRKVLTSTIMTVCACLRRFKERKSQNQFVKTLWDRYIPRILRFCLTASQYCHQLSCNDLQNLLPILSKITAIGIGEKMIILGISTKHTQNFANYQDSELNKLNTWYTTLRDSSYRCLCYLVEILGDEFYNFTDIGNELNTCLFSKAKDLPNSAWRALLTVSLKPIFLGCPHTHYKLVLDHIAGPLLSFLTEKLDREWTSLVCQTEETDFDLKVENIPDEVVSEKLLRDLTRAFADFLHICVKHDVKKGMTSESVTFANPHLVEFFTSGQRLKPFFNSLIQLLVYKDIHGCSKSLSILIALTPQLAQNNLFHELLGSQVLAKALQVLHDGYKKENHNDAVHLVSEIYHHLGPISPFPKNIFMSLPGMTLPNLLSFETKLADSNIKSRLLITKSFLEPIMGLELSRLFQKKGSFELSMREKNLLSKPDTDSHRGNIMENSEDVNLDVLYDS